MELPEGWETGSVEANGVNLQFYRTGEGPAVVYAHGFLCNGRCPRRLVDDLADEYEVLTYDARGHGQSDAPNSGYTLADRAADLVGLLDALGVESPVLVGHSMGGATVAAAAAAHPDRPRAVVLEDPAGFVGEPPLGPDERAERVRTDLAEWGERDLDDLEAERAHDLGPARVRAVPDQPRREAVGLTECRPAVAEIAREGYPTDEYAEEILPAVDAPTLVLRADASPDQRRADLDAADALPDGRLVHVPDADHYVFGSRYEAAMRELRTFLLGL